MKSPAHWGNLDLNSRETAFKLNDDVRVPVVLHFEHGCADLLQYVREQTLSAIAELTVPDLDPQSPQYRRNSRRVS